MTMNAAYYLLRSGNVFFHRGTCFSTASSTTTTSSSTPLRCHTACARFWVQKEPYFNPLQGPQPCLPAWPVYFYIFVFLLHLKRKKNILRSSLGGEREMCVFQWLFITILIQTRLINQFTTFYNFFIQCTHAIVKICRVYTWLEIAGKNTCMSCSDLDGTWFSRSGSSHVSSVAMCAQGLQETRTA
jgi:hypothetical protein